MRKIVALFLIFIYLFSFVKPVKNEVLTANLMDKAIKEGIIACTKELQKVLPDIYQFSCIVSTRNQTNLKFEFGPSLSFGQMEFLGYSSTLPVENSVSKNRLEFKLPAGRTLLRFSIKANFKPTVKVDSKLEKIFFEKSDEFFEAINALHNIETLATLKEECEASSGKVCELEYRLREIVPSPYFSLLDQKEMGKILSDGRLNKKVDGKELEFKIEEDKVKVYENKEKKGEANFEMIFVPVGGVISYSFERLTSDYLKHPAGVFKQWGDISSLPKEGWKLHVSVAKEDFDKFASVVLPYLKRENVAHKIVLPEYYEVMKGAQAGKILTIYTKNPKEALEVAKKLDALLYSLNIKPGAIPPNEGVFPGSFKGITYRYSNFFGGSILDPTGKEIKDSELRMGIIPKGWSNSYRPSYITDEFTLYIDTKEGKLVEAPTVVNHHLVSTKYINPKTGEVVQEIKEGEIISKPAGRKFISREDIISNNFQRGDTVVFRITPDPKNLEVGEIEKFDPKTGFAEIFTEDGLKKVNLESISNNPIYDTMINKKRKVEIQQFTEALWAKTGKEGKISSLLNPSDVETIVNKGFVVKGGKIYATDKTGNLLEFSVEDFTRIPELENSFWDTFKGKITVIPKELAEFYPAKIKGIAITSDVLNQIQEWSAEKFLKGMEMQPIAAFLGMNEKGVIDKVYFTDVTVGSLKDFWRYEATKISSKLEGRKPLFAFLHPAGATSQETLGEVLAARELFGTSTPYVMTIVPSKEEVKISLFYNDFRSLSKEETNNLELIWQSYTRYYREDISFTDARVVKKLEFTTPLETKFVMNAALKNLESFQSNIEKGLKDLKKLAEYGMFADRYYGITEVSESYAFRYINQYYPEFLEKVKVWENALEKFKEEGQILPETYELYKLQIARVKKLGEFTTEAPEEFLEELKRVEKAVKRSKASVLNTILNSLEQVKAKISQVLERKIYDDTLDKVISDATEAAVEKVFEPEASQVLRKIDEKVQEILMKNQEKLEKPIAIVEKTNINRITSFSDCLDDAERLGKIVTDPYNMKILKSGQVIKLGDEKIISFSEGKINILDFPSEKKIFTSLINPQEVVVRHREGILTPHLVDEVVKENNGIIPTRIHFETIRDGKPVSIIYDLSDWEEKGYVINGELTSKLYEDYSSLASKGDYEKIEKEIFGYKYKLDLPLPGESISIEELPTLSKIQPSEFSKLTTADIKKISDSLSPIQFENIKNGEKVFLKFDEREIMLQKIDNGMIGVFDVEKVGEDFKLDGGLGSLSFDELKNGKFSSSRTFPKEFEIEWEKIDANNPSFVLKDTNTLLERKGNGVVSMSEVIDGKKIDFVSLDVEGEKLLTTPSKIDADVLLTKFMKGEENNLAFRLKDDIYNFVKTKDGIRLEINGEKIKIISEDVFKEELAKFQREGAEYLKPFTILGSVDVDSELVKLQEKGFSSIYKTSEGFVRLENVEEGIKMTDLTTGVSKIKDLDEIEELLQTAEKVKIEDTSSFSKFLNTKLISKLDIGPTDVLAMVILSPTLYTLSDDKDEAMRRIAYNTVENFLIEPLVLSGAKSVIQGTKLAASGLGGVATLGVLTAIVAAENVAEDITEEWLRTNKLKNMGIEVSSDIGSIATRVFSNYADFWLPSLDKKAIENSDIYKKSLNGIYSDLYSTVLEKANKQIFEKIGNRKDEVLKGIEKTIEYWKDWPKGNYLMTVNGFEYIWSKEKNQIEAKYKQDGDDVKIVFEIVDGNLIPTNYERSGKEKKIVHGYEIEQYITKDSVSVDKKTLLEEAERRTKELRNKIEGDLRSLFEMDNAEKIKDKAKEIAEKLNSDPEFLKHFGRPISPLEIIQLAISDADLKLEEQSKTPQLRFAIPFTQKTKELLENAKNELSKENKFVFSSSVCEKVGGVCKIACPEGFIEIGECEKRGTRGHVVSILCCKELPNEYEDCTIKEKGTVCITERYYKSSEEISVTFSYECEEGFGENTKCVKGHCKKTVEKAFACKYGCDATTGECIKPQIPEYVQIGELLCPQDVLESSLTGEVVITDITKCFYIQQKS